MVISTECKHVCHSVDLGICMYFLSVFCNNGRRRRKHNEKRNDIVRVNYPFSPWSRSLAEILATFVPTGSFSIRETCVGLLAVSNSGSLSLPVLRGEKETCNECICSNRNRFVLPKKDNGKGYMEKHGMFM